MEAALESDQATLKKELSTLSFEEILGLKEKLGDKVVKAALHGETDVKDVAFKRVNKNRPREMSSKKPVSTLREVIKVKKKVSRDPRFDDLSGVYNEHVFKSSYAFLDDIKSKEKKEIERTLRKEKDPTKKQKLKSLLQRMVAQQKQEEKKVIDSERKREWRKSQVDNIKHGKRPYFLKRSHQKLMDLADKYEKLKNTGKLEKYLIKKRKKNAMKDRKLLPTTSGDGS